jgi:hypothetical protein
MRLRIFAALSALIALGGFAALAAAQEGVRSEVDARKIGLQDQVVLTITAEGSSLPDEVGRPALVNLRYVGVPSVSTQVSIVNGRSSQARIWTYTLQPVAIGPAEVGAVKVRLAAGEAGAPAIVMEVVAGSIRPAPARRSLDPFGDDPFGGMMERRRPTEPQLFVEAKPSRTGLFVGEPLLITYYLYTRASVSGLQFSNPPEYPGFWAEDLPASGQPVDEPTTVEGVAYHRFAVMKKLLFPTKSGRLTIPSASIDIQIPPQGFFDSGGTARRPTKPVTIEVKPIPEEPGFSGAVGHFQASSSVDRSTLAFGEAATLRFTVEGSGNLKWVDRGPELSVPGAKVYPPQVKSNLEVKPNGITGSRTWEFVVVPQTLGTLEIPALAFSYFDPTTRAVVRSTTRALALEVQGAPGAAAPVPMSGPGAAARGGPLPLRTDLDLPSSWAAAIPGRWVGLAAIAILLLHGLLWGGDALARIGRGAPGRVAAPASVRGALGDLRRVGRDGLSKEAAAGLIEKTIHRVFGSLDGDASERARAVRALLEEVHAVRYAPQLGDYSERLRELAARAGEVVRRWA